MKMLCLDLATQMGWAVFDEKGLPVEGGSLNLGEKITRPARLHKLARWLGQLLNARPQIQRIAAEGPAYNQNIRHGASLAAIVELIAEDRDIPVVEVAPTSLKKHATGSGRAGKPEMEAAARARWPGVSVIDHNHADALLVGGWALDEVEDWGDT